MESFKTVVPGRVCLLGEHADWAGPLVPLSHEQCNDALNAFRDPLFCVSIVGQAKEVVDDSPTGVGLSLLVTTEAAFQFTATQLHAKRNDSAASPSLSVNISSEGFGDFLFELSAEQPNGDSGISKERYGDWVYAAGVLEEFYERYKEELGCCVVDIKVQQESQRNPLLIKKGISSSAAFCVGIARCLLHLLVPSRHVDDHLSTEMDIAYSGERRAGSKCGRMDQCCAAGPGKVLLIAISRHELKGYEVPIGGDMSVLVADLGASKDTAQILADLRKGLEQDERRCTFFSSRNHALLLRATACLRNGNVVGLCRAYSHYQEEFDAACGDVCPTQLGVQGSPVLHRVIEDGRREGWHIKGIGSQGDGAALMCVPPEDESGGAEFFRSALDTECMIIRLKKQLTGTSMGGEAREEE